MNNPPQPRCLITSQLTPKKLLKGRMWRKTFLVWLLVTQPMFRFAAAIAENAIDYGAAKVNSMAATPGTKLGGADSFDYLALKNHHGPSGVPLGGIGVGCFDYAPDGRFTRICINNWHAADQSPVIEQAPGTFLAVWRDGQAGLLQRGADFAGMTAAKETIYQGLFPTANCQVDADTVVRAWSGLVPHDVKDSSLPLAWIEVELKNPTNTKQPVAVAFSWQDVIGRDIVEVTNLDLLRASPTVWGKEEAFNKAWKQGITGWGVLNRVPTQAEPFKVGNLAGIRQFSAPLQPVLKTYQNYNNEIVLLAEKSSGAEISVLPAYRVDDATAAWADFRKAGEFSSAAGAIALYDPFAKHEMASAVAVRVTLKPGEKRVVRFAVAWFQPELKIDPAQDDPGTYFGNADHGRFYQNYFATVSDLVSYAAREREHIHDGTLAWQKPILDSTYPDWLKFKVINSAYPIYASSILNRAGEYTMMEGGMGGLAGTMDQQISAHPFYFKFFPQLERANLELFGLNPGRDGQILHFDGHYFFGLDTRDGRTPVPENCMLDNTGGWLLQMAECAEQSGDVAWIKPFDAQIHRSLAFLRARVESKQFQIITGATTYDDFWHPEIYAYNASTYPAFLRAGAVLLEALGQTNEAATCRIQAVASAADAKRALWNGRFFAYGADLDGAHRRDDIMFSGQLAGQFLSRYLGWGDVYPMPDVQSSVLAQLQSNIARSPDFYAPKVWSLKENKAMMDPRRPDDPNADSTCWPFYEESYTAMAAIQAGHIADGLNILRHIQLVNLRNGWTWTQNLWRPGELTYMTAPVTWFITDVLAGSSLNLPADTMALAPVLAPDEIRAVLPVYFPRFWGVVTADRATRKLTFTVTKEFDGPPITLRHVVSQSAGMASSQGHSFAIPPFKVHPGRVLDLSSHWDEIMAGEYQPPVLPSIADTLAH